MDSPLYSGTVESVTELWSYDVTQGVKPSETAAVLLADQLAYRWGYQNNVVPGQLLPDVASYGLYCMTADDIPAVQLGDLHKITLRVGAAGPVIKEQVMRVAEIEATLEPDEDETHPVYVAVTLVGLVADAIAAPIQQPLGAPAGTYDGIGYDARYFARDWWRSRIAEVGKLLGRSIGVPDWWAAGYDGEHPDPGTLDGLPATPAYRGLAFADPAVGAWNGKSGQALLTELLNSHQPDEITHVLAPCYDDTYPAGYEYVEDDNAPEWPAIADPDSDVRYLLVPASRVDGWHGVLELDGDDVDVPAKARRSREHVSNVVNVGGLATLADSADPLLLYKWTAAVMTYFDAGDVTAHGIQARDLPTQLRLFQFPNDNPVDYQPLAPEDVAANFLTDASARSSAWTYDAFQIVCSDLDQVVAEEILPAIAPRYPGETDGDGQVLRHVTIGHLDPSIQFNPADVADHVAGFLVAGQLSVVDGDMVWNLTLTPGDPV